MRHIYASFNGFSCKTATADRQTERQRDRQTGSQIGRQAGRQADRQTGRQADRKGDRQAVRQRDGQTQTEKDIHTDRQTDTQAASPICTDMRGGSPDTWRHCQPLLRIIIQLAAVD